MQFSRTIRLSILMLLWCNWVSSQSYITKNYTSATVLPNNSVRSLLIDSNNVLWIGTENGVVKRENDEFQYFFEEDGLALNSCWAIAEDFNKKMWFGSYGGGISIYDGSEFEVISEEDGLAHNEITTLFSHGDFMYVGTSNGVSVININNLEVFSPGIPMQNALFRVYDFLEYGNEIYVLTYNSGIFKIRKKKNGAALVKVSDFGKIYSVLVENDSIYSSNKGFYTKTGLDQYLKTAQASAEKLGKSIIWDYVKTSGDQIFAAAWGIYDSDGGIYELVDDEMTSRAADFNIPTKEAFSLAYDPLFERLYVGTKNAGLFEIALDPEIKFNQTKGKTISGFAKTENTSAVLLHDGILLKGTDEQKKITLFQLKEWQENYIRTTTRPLPEHQDDFYELDHSTPAEDIGFYDIKSRGRDYWINTNIGIYAIGESGELHRYMPLHSEEINFTPEGHLIETNPYGGVRVYSNPGAFEYSHYDSSSPHTPTMIVSSLQNAGKTYLLSVFSGLYVWENGKFSSYFKKGIWSEKKLKHITALGDKLAISNEFGDVFLLKDEKCFEVLKKIPRAQIRGNTIAFLKEYNKSLLIGTEKGLTLYKNGRFIFLDKEQGLEQPFLSAEVTGKFLTIGSKGGFYKIDLEAIGNSKPIVTHITIKEIFVNNNSRNRSPVNQKLNLDHEENSVLLKFSTNAHPYPGKLSYQYRLNTDQEWSLPSSKPEIFLASLPTGDYEIDVKVQDESTGFSYTQPLLRLAILPPFWNTWWFVLLVISFLSLGIYGFYSFQMSQTLRFEEQKGLIQKRFEETKMEALLSQMNPHFIFNAMNSIQYYIMESNIEKATAFLGDFAKLIRLNLDHCARPKILLVEEIEYLQSYVRVENTRFDNAIEVTIDVDPDLDIYEIEIPTMILQTFVENVFVHAFPAGVKNPALEISFVSVPANILECRIQDNGIGYSFDTTNKLHQSKGVKLVKERLSLLGYRTEVAVQIDSRKGEGTTVKILLKV